MSHALRHPFRPEDIERLRPGDLLLYSSGGPICWAIKLKTWSRISHVEVYMGAHLSYASRYGTGVRSYPIRLSGLVTVVRPTEPFDATAAIAWHNIHGAGRPYDWKGLFRYFRIGRQSDDAFFCSEYATALLRAGGAHLFARSFPNDLVPPGYYLSTPHGVAVWTDEGGWNDQG